MTYLNAAQLRPGDIVRFVYGPLEPVEITCIEAVNGPRPYPGPHGSADAAPLGWIITGYRYDPASRSLREVSGYHTDRPLFLRWAGWDSH